MARTTPAKLQSADIPPVESIQAKENRERGKERRSHLASFFSLSCPPSLFIVPLDIGDRKHCFPTYNDALACEGGSQRRRSISAPLLSRCNG